MVSITSAPSTPSIASRMCSQCSLPGGVDDDVAQASAGVALDARRPRRRSRRRRRSRSCTRPSTPGLSSSLTRIVRRYWALGVALTCWLPPWLAAGHVLRKSLHAQAQTPARGADAPRAPRRVGAMAVGTKQRRERRRSASAGPAGERRLFLIDGPSLVYRAFFALPESIATSTGSADQRDLRVRLDAREDRHRVRRLADRRRVGRRHLRPHRAVRRLQGPAPLAPGPAQAAVAGDGTAGRGVRLHERARSRATRPTT